MKSVLFSIGNFHIYGYGFMIALGIIVAYIVAEKRAPSQGLDPNPIIDLTITCAIGGLLGAKLLYLITIWEKIVKDPSVLLSSLTDGFVVYGGIIGGILVGYVFTRIKKLSFLKHFDLVMPSIALAQAFGRIGCFLAGCCYGKETTHAFCVVFPEGSLAPAGVPLIPTQLISSGLNFLHFLFLVLFAAKWKKADGQVGFLYLICYSAGRFILEFFRGDAIRGTVGALSTSQFIAVFLFAIGVIGFAICTKMKFGQTKQEA